MNYGHSQKLVYCVGKSTENACRAHGYGGVIVSAPDSKSLEVRIAKARSVKHLVYFAGEHRFSDLEIKLGMLGKSVNLLEVYRAELVNPGKDVLLEALNQVSGGVCLLFSARTAIHFFRLCDDLVILKDLELRGLVAISPHVANAVGPLTKFPIWIAEKPDLDAMISEVIRIYRD